MFYALMLDGNGNGIGSHSYVEDPVSYPPNEIACSSAQATTPMMYQVVNGLIVESLTASQAAQSQTIATACSAAESAPLYFTNGAGTAGSFPMDSAKLAKYLGVYAKYCVKGVAFPNGALSYDFYDVYGKAVAMTLTDIENFFNAVESTCDSTLAKQATLLADIASATTVSAVQAVVW